MKGCGYGKRDISTPWYGTKREERAHTRRHKCKRRYVIRRNVATNVVPTMHDEGPHTPSFFFCLTGRNERESRRRERQRHTPGRRQGKSACQGEGRAEEREKSVEATNKTRGSQQPSKGRAQGRGHSRHTAHGGHHTAPKHQRGEHQRTRERRDHAPRHAPHRHHEHRTHPRPCPQHLASEPRQPCQEGRQLGEGERLTPDAPHNGGRHPPRGRFTATPTASNASPQGCTLWGWCWVLTPAPTALGTHGSRNPGRPPHRAGGRGRDSA